MKRSKFNLSHYRLQTFEMGQLCPVGLVEVLPGDTFQHSTSALVRFSPMAAPVMHPIEVRIHHFFVPHRLAWEKSEAAGSWEDFITGGPDGNDSSVIPTVGPGTVTEAVLGNYYGIPRDTVVESGEISRLPFDGYVDIWNEYYRDQDLQAPLSGTQYLQPLQRVSWEKDYFTGARPWAQKGDDVTLPVGTTAPVVAENTGFGPSFQTPQGTGGYRLDGVQNQNDANWSGNADGTGSFLWDNPNLVADLSNAANLTANEFRRMFALQRYAEARARYGSRYTEYLRYLGIRPSDARLQRPEYLGGGKVAMAISEVMQTAPEGDTPSRPYGVGDMYGHGVGAIRSRPYRRFFEEHGYVHSLMSIRPKTQYMDALPRHWLKRSREEFFQKELQQIGQQEVWNGEVYTNAADTYGTFGYVDRYQEYKYQPSQVTSEFESTLNYWHLGRDLASEPVLNESFIQCNPSKRIFNEQTQDSCWVMLNHHLVARRLVRKGGSSRVL